MRRILVSIVVATLCLVDATAHAAQVSQPMNVTVAIGPRGPQVTITVDPLVMSGDPPGPATGTSIVHVNAPSGMNFVVYFGGGLHFSPGPGGAHRSLAGSSPLPYFLYMDAAYTQPWGDGSPDLGPGLPQVAAAGGNTLVVYGRTASWVGSTLENETVSDVVTVAVSF